MMVDVAAAQQILVFADINNIHPSKTWKLYWLSEYSQNRAVLGYR